MKTFPKLMITGLMVLFAAAISAQTINVELTITNDDDVRYTAMFYVYNNITGDYCEITSTNPITNLENGTTPIRLECSVPYDTSRPVYRVEVVVWYNNGEEAHDSTPFLNTDELYDNTHQLEINF